MKSTILKAVSIVVATLMLAGCSSTPATVAPVEPSSSSITVIPPVSEPTVSENPSTPDLPDLPASSEAPASVSTAPVVAKSWWVELFTCEDTFMLMRNFYLHDNTSKLSYMADNNYQYQWLAAAVVHGTDAGSDIAVLGKPIQENLYVEMVMDSDDKYTVRFYEKGISLAHSHWKTKDKTTVLLDLTNGLDSGFSPSSNGTLSIDGLTAAEYYDGLRRSVIAEMQDGKITPNVMWLSMMNRGRIRGIAVTAPKGSKVSYSTKDSLEMMYLVEPYIRNIYVTGAATIGKAETPMVDNTYTVEMTFNNDVKYRVQAGGNRLLVSSSDVQGTVLSYTLANADKTVENLQDIVDKHINPNTPNYDYSFTPANPSVNPETGKPVIYLYPTKTTDCTVTVDYDSFSYTYPTYNKGWQVTAHPDGRLINKADGSEHYYLFWEGNKRVNWRFDSGFVVAGNDVESFLRDKLAYMGLTPREYNDFITYWVPRMQDNAYNLITFAGEQYEQLAPLTVTPAPDSVLRVHMVYKAIDTPVTIPEQQLNKFTRKGFTVVEWGGSVTG